jgi:tetrahydromethanopterin S-methyltransferase subunit G
MKPIGPRSKTESSSTAALNNEILIQTVAKVDRSALGITIGILLGAGIFFITNFLILKGGNPPGLTLSRLNQYFFGYTVTFIGSFIGLFYGFITGFILGWFIALLRNFVISIYLYIARFRARMISVNNFIDYP